jgi:hypothetical protein
MLPQLRFQLQVYRLGEKQPPSGSMVGHAPHWSIIPLLLDPRATQQVRVNLQPDFHWLATMASSTAPAVPVSFAINSILRSQLDPATGLIQTILVDKTDWVDPPVGTLITYNGLTTWPGLNGLSFPFFSSEEVGLPGNPLQVITTFPLANIPPGAPPLNSQLPETGSISLTLPATPIPAGFRAQIYDTRKGLRMADRGVRVANLGGDTHGVQWFRDPYVFDLPNSQVLLIVQNLVNQANEIQIALYGQVLRFNQIQGTN